MAKRLTTVEECRAEADKVAVRAMEQEPDYEVIGQEPNVLVVNMGTRLTAYEVDTCRGRCTCNYQILADDMNDILLAAGEPLAVCKHVHIARYRTGRQQIARQRAAGLGYFPKGGG